MRETISIQVGKCGILLGHEFWKKISIEHAINPDGSISFQGFSKKEGLNLHFSENYRMEFIFLAQFFSILSLERYKRLKMEITRNFIKKLI